MQHIRRFVGNGISRGRVVLLLRMGLAIGSFVIYAGAATVLKEHRHSQYRGEEMALAAAVSTVVYAAPMGTVYSGLLKQFVRPPRAIQEVLEGTARGATEPGPLLNVIPDDYGLGYPVVTILAMCLFGLHLSSMTFILIALMGISTFVFLLRYQNDGLLAVPLYFLSLTIMLFTPLVTYPKFADEVPIGGSRYFSLLAILPAVHIFWEIADPPKSKTNGRAGNLILLGFQALLLAVVIIVRASAGYLLAALAVAYFLTLRARRGKPTQLRDLIRKGAFTAGLGAAFVGSLYLWVPEAYKESGRAMAAPWHRVLISLGANPGWPFGNLREVYSSCEPYTPPRQYSTPQSLVPGIVDWNGHCIWWVYALEHGLTPGETIGEIYGGRYETVMKQTFFEIVRQYPKEVWETFVYYKPALIFRSLRRLLDFHLPGETFAIRSLILALLLAQAAGLIAFIGSGAPGWSEDATRRLTGVFLLFSVCSLAPPLVAWSNPFTSADLLFYLFAGLGLALAAVIGRVRESFRRSDLGTPG